MNKKNYEILAQEIGKLVDEKNKNYGNSFSKCAEFLKLLYPINIPTENYGDMLCVVRIFDKLMRIATKKGAYNESPYVDIVGYGLLGTMKDEEEEQLTKHNTETQELVMKPAAEKNIPPNIEACCDICKAEIPGGIPANQLTQGNKVVHQHCFETQLQNIKTGIKQELPEEKQSRSCPEDRRTVRLPGHINKLSLNNKTLRYIKRKQRQLKVMINKVSNSIR